MVEYVLFSPEMKANCKKLSVSQARAAAAASHERSKQKKKNASKAAQYVPYRPDPYKKSSYKPFQPSSSMSSFDSDDDFDDYEIETHANNNTTTKLTSKNFKFGSVGAVWLMAAVAFVVAAILMAHFSAAVSAQLLELRKEIPKSVHLHCEQQQQRRMETTFDAAE
jgi:cell division protein FtsL